MSQSLFTACKRAIRSGASGTQDVGGYDIGLELYTQADIDANVLAIRQGQATKCTFGDSDESKIVVVYGDTVTIPAGFTLSPVSPKKSLVIYCNTLINNGTVSMTGKGPNVTPHPYTIIQKTDGYSDDIIIPAYANNAASSDTPVNFYTKTSLNGIAGTNRNCGSGGAGAVVAGLATSTPKGYYRTTGSGYAFGGGAGSGGFNSYSTAEPKSNRDPYNVSTQYPMRGGAGSYIDSNATGWGAWGGVGNPSGTSINNATKYAQNTGVGGRVIIFCNSFTNNSTIVANGISAQTSKCVHGANGGASGGGAIDVFTNEILTQGSILSVGGSGAIASNMDTTQIKSGDGGAGCVTLTTWDMGQVCKFARKKFSKSNWTYLFEEYVSRLNEEV